MPGREDLKTLPQHFRVNGYHTLTMRKIFHGGYGREEGGPDWDVVGSPESGKPFPEQKLVNTPAPHRVLKYKDGMPVWEGKVIAPGDAIPEME